MINADFNIHRYKPQLPHLADSFERARNIKPSERPTWAKQKRRSVYRDGWFVNTPVAKKGDAETVEDHIQHLMALIKQYFPKHTHEQATLYAEYHDDHEVIAHAVIDGVKRDLNPRFNQASYQITLDQKEEIEAAAREILFENFPEIIALLNRYPNSTEEAAILFRDFDKICVMWKCVEFAERRNYKYSDFRAYWDYWTPERVRQKCSSLTADIYAQDLWPRALDLKNN